MCILGDYIMIEQIEMGDPIILKNSEGLTEYMLFDGCKGMCNAYIVVNGDEEYIQFHPNGMGKFFWTRADRFVLDEEKVKAMAEESLKAMGVIDE
jgi:hypothetical protein